MNKKSVTYSSIVKKINVLLILTVLIFGCSTKKNTQIIKNSYPLISERLEAPAGKTFYIDPNKGDDFNAGTKNKPWKTFKKVNQLQLTDGNTIEILSPGDLRESLFLTGKGTEKNPITVNFAPGTYNFYPQNAYKDKFNISNTNDAPEALKAVAFYFLEAEHVNVNGNGAEIIFRGKVMETAIRYSKNISIENLSFDYKRPTVSEFEVFETTNSYIDAKVHPDSKYKITDSTLVWVGEGWEHKAHPLWQEYNPVIQQVSRVNFPVDKLRFSELEKDKIRVYFSENPGFKKGLTYQNRDTFRDYAAIFTERSENINWKNVNVYFMHGMGFVSQFTETISFDGLSVKPKEGSGRTCAAWADILHFSGCKGNITVKNSFLSAANDDAINVHGTHLRIIETLSDNKIKVRFMHPQAFGFEGFLAGDSVEFINHNTLLPYAKNKVLEANMLNAKEMELTLEQVVPEDIEPNDVLENATWTPNVTITGNKVTYIPTRGFLISTRGKVVIENNTFLKPFMSAILIADDANSWYESGYVRDVTIKNNTFIECGSPVIYIHPENRKVEKDGFVHHNINILNNTFNIYKETILAAKSTKNIQFINNTIEANDKILLNDILHFSASENVEIKNNSIN